MLDGAFFRSSLCDERESEGFRLKEKRCLNSTGTLHDNVEGTGKYI